MLNLNKLLLLFFTHINLSVSALITFVELQRSQTKTFFFLTKYNQRPARIYYFTIIKFITNYIIHI